MYKTRSKSLQFAVGHPKESDADKELKLKASNKTFVSNMGGKTIKVGHVITGTVTRILDYGVFVSVDEIKGFIHVSEISSRYVSNPSERFKAGDKIKAVVISIDFGKNIVNLSIKNLSDKQHSH